MPTLSRDQLHERLAAGETVRGPGGEKAPQEGVTRDGDTVTVTTAAGQTPDLGAYDLILERRGLDPADWTVVSVKANQWDAMTSDKAEGDNRIVTMYQHTITLKPSARLVLIQPAVHVPPVKRTRPPGPAVGQKPVTILVEGDHQAPYHDPDLHAASIFMLRDLARKHRLSEHIFLGDTMDLPTISRHNDHPASRATPNECIQAAYALLREKAETAPNIRRRKIKGNHDWRIDSEQLTRSERMYGIRPAKRWEDTEEELPALHLNRLLHLPELGIELVEDPRGWEHAEIELVPGPQGLVVRHGWLTGENTAEKSAKARGRSIIFGHVHRAEDIAFWDPSMECPRQGVVCPAMCLTRDKRFPHFAVLDRWMQGAVIVTTWPDGEFAIERALWKAGELRWRDQTWRAA